MNKLVKKYQLELNAVDAEGNGIKFESADAERYLELKSSVSRTMTETCKSLVEIEEKKYYLMDGYMSMKEFVTDAFSFGYRMATNYMLVEKTFGEIGVNYSNFPVVKLLEIAKDEDKMRVLKKVKDPEAKIIDYIQEMKEKQFSGGKKKKESDAGTLAVIPLRQFRENMQLFGLSILKPDFDWNNEENLNEIGHVIETWQGIVDSIDGLFLANIDRVRTERKEKEKEQSEIMAEISEANDWAGREERDGKKKRRKKNAENTAEHSEPAEEISEPEHTESAETVFEGNSEG